MGSVPGRGGRTGQDCADDSPRPNRAGVTPGRSRPHEGHGHRARCRQGDDAPSRRGCSHAVGSARSLAASRAAWWRHDAAAGLRCRARRPRHRAARDLRPLGPGQHLGRDPRHRARDAPALRHPLADHRALVRGVDRRHRGPGPHRPAGAAAERRAADGRRRAGRRWSSASCSTPCWARPPGARPRPTSPASTRTSLSSSWPSPPLWRWPDSPTSADPCTGMVVGAISISALCAVVGAYGLPLGVIAAIIVGWGTAAACHLAMGAPNGLPSATEVTDAVRDLQVEVHGLTSTTRQEWGVASFAGTDTDGHALELAVYGRDAADAQWLRKVWRFCIYRDSGPTLVINRLQQVEHEAYLTFLAAHAGAIVPEIVAAGRCGPAHDAALVTRLPEGHRLAALAADDVERRRRRWLPPFGPPAAPGRNLARLAQPRDGPRHERGAFAAGLPARLVLGPGDADRPRPGGRRRRRRRGGGRRPYGRRHLSRPRHGDDPGGPHPPAALHARPRDRAHGPRAEGLSEVAARVPRHRRRGRGAEVGGGQEDQLAQPADGHRESRRALADHRRADRGFWFTQCDPRRRPAVGGGRLRPGTAPGRHRSLGPHGRRHRAAAVRSLRRPRDVEHVHLLRRRRRRSVRRAGALLPAPGSRRAGRHQLGGDRRHAPAGW